MMSVDIDLLRAFVAGSEDDFRRLVRRHIDFVYGSALRRTRCPHRAKDVAQIVFCHLARKARLLVHRRDLVGWLYITTQYSATSLIRSEARRSVREQHGHDVLNALACPTHDSEWRALSPILEAALDQLTPTDRAAVVLRFFQNRSFHEVGHELGLSEDAARKRVDRALSKLHSILKRKGMTSSSAALATILVQHSSPAAPTALAMELAARAISGGIAGGTSALIGTLKVSALAAAAAAMLFAQPSTPPGSRSQHQTSSHIPAVSRPSNFDRLAAPDASTPSDETRDQPRFAAATHDSSPSSFATDPHRQIVLRRYGGLFDRLALSPATREQLIALLIGIRHVNGDLNAQRKQTPAETPNVRRSNKVEARERIGEFRRQIAVLLGEAGYIAFMETHAAVRQLAMVDHLETRLRDGPDALTEKQQQDLETLVLTQRFNRVTDEVIELASEYLTSVQLQALRELGPARRDPEPSEG